MYFLSWVLRFALGQFSILPEQLSLINGSMHWGGIIEAGHRHAITKMKYEYFEIVSFSENQYHYNAACTFQFGNPCPNS